MRKEDPRGLAMELTVGPADFGVPAARTSVGMIPPGGRLACGAWRLVTWRPLHGRPLRGDRDLGLFGRCRPTHGSPRNGRRTGRLVTVDARVAGEPREWAILWPLAWCRSQADMHVPRVGTWASSWASTAWGVEIASLIGASRALPYLGRRERFLIWDVEIASVFGASRSLLYGSAR